MGFNMFLKFIQRVINRERTHPFLTYPIFLLRILVCRYRYAKTIRRIRSQEKKKKIRVAFLSMDTSKWKCQSIYELMAKSNLYDPFIALTITAEDENRSAKEIKERNAEARKFYESLGCKVVEACNAETRQVYSAKQLEADIVFFQVPWGNLRGQTVWDVSRYALSCYMPYGVEVFEWQSKSTRFDFHHMANFQLLMWANFVWSEEYAKWYRFAQHNWEWSGCIIGAGHSTFDVITNEDIHDGDLGRYVIYAPHFSFPWDGHDPIMNFSTFPWSGKAILEYAKNHPEMKWAFKPHPKLRERLSEIGYMTKSEVDAYYAEWERIGAVCYDGGYASLFCQSRAMVTDCGSFLSEYMAVGKPLIRLIPDNIKVRPCPGARKYFETFYNCYNVDEMQKAFNLVLERGEDPKRDARISACKEANLIGNYAAKKVMRFIESKLF